MVRKANFCLVCFTRAIEFVIFVGIIYSNKHTRELHITEMGAPVIIF